MFKELKCGEAPTWWSSKQQRKRLSECHHLDAGIWQCEKGKKKGSGPRKDVKCKLKHIERVKRETSIKKEVNHQCLLPEIRFTVQEE